MALSTPSLPSSLCFTSFSLYALPPSLTTPHTFLEILFHIVSARRRGFRLHLLKKQNKQTNKKTLFMLSLRCMLQFGWLLLFPEKNLLVLVRWELLLFKSSHLLMITAREVLQVESLVGTHLSLFETVYICVYNHLHIRASTLYWTAAAAAKSLQSCPTLCNPLDSSPPGFPVPGIGLRLTLMVRFLIILQHSHM